MHGVCRAGSVLEVVDRVGVRRFRGRFRGQRPRWTRPRSALNHPGEGRKPLAQSDGNGISGAPFAQLLAEHGNNTIDHISVSAGHQFSDQVEAAMKRMRINADEFDFGAGGPQGQQGDPGAAGPTGPAGPTGEHGPVSQGAITSTNAANGSTGAVPAASDSKLVGNTVRSLHISKQHKGTKLVSVKATLRGHNLRVHGNTITGDLRNRAAGITTCRPRPHTRRAARPTSFTSPAA